MEYLHIYSSEIGYLILTANDQGLTGCRFGREERLTEWLKGEYKNETNEHIDAAVLWLDEYFSGKKPEVNLSLKSRGTEFQLMVWEELQKIPYGCSLSYGDIAKSVAKKLGKDRMSAQAVGGAVGRNPIGIIIPCHRVLGADRSLTGFGGGLDVKKVLLQIEGIEFRE